MSTIVKLRAATFIPVAWLDSPRDGEQDVEFRGDDRDFTPHAVHTGRSRVEQEVVVDLARETVLPYADTGRSKERVEQPDGTVEVREGKADSSGIHVSSVEWSDGCAFRIRADASNPLVEAADSVNYDAQVSITSDGAIHVAGEHDGFPCFEFYAQTDFGTFATLYTYDYRENGGSPVDLSGPPEYVFNVTKQ